MMKPQSCDALPKRHASSVASSVGSRLTKEDQAKRNTLLGYEPLSPVVKPNALPLMPTHKRTFWKLTRTTFVAVRGRVCPLFPFCD
jgi:hypothetical protein